MSASGEVELRAVPFPSSADRGDGPAPPMGGERVGFGAPVRAATVQAVPSHLPASASPAAVPHGARRRYAGKGKRKWEKPVMFFVFVIIHAIILLALMAFVMRNFYQIKAEKNGIVVDGKVEADNAFLDEATIGNIQLMRSSNEVLDTGGTIESTGVLTLRPTEWVEVENGLVVDDLRLEKNTLSSTGDIVFDLGVGSSRQDSGLATFEVLRNGKPLLHVRDGTMEVEGDVIVKEGGEIKLEEGSKITSESTTSEVATGSLEVDDVLLENNMLYSSANLTIHSANNRLDVGANGEFTVARSPRVGGGSGAALHIAGQDAGAVGVGAQGTGGDVHVRAGDGSQGGPQGSVVASGAQVRLGNTDESTTLVLGNGLDITSTDAARIDAAELRLGTDGATDDIVIGRPGVLTEIDGPAAVNGPLSANSLDRDVAGVLDIGTNAASAVNVARSGVTTSVRGPLDVTATLHVDEDASFGAKLTTPDLRVDEIAAADDGADEILLRSTIKVAGGASIKAADGAASTGQNLVLEGGAGSDVTTGPNFNGGNVILRGGVAGVGGSGGALGFIDVQSDMRMAGLNTLTAPSLLADTIDAVGSGPVAVDQNLHVNEGFELQTDSITAAQTNGDVTFNTDLVVSPAQTLRVDTIDGATAGAAPIDVARSLKVDANAELLANTVKSATGSVVNVDATLQATQVKCDEFIATGNGNIVFADSVEVADSESLSTPVLNTDVISTLKTTGLSIQNDVNMAPATTLAVDRVSASGQPQVDVLNDLRIAATMSLRTDTIAASASSLGVTVEDHLLVGATYDLRANRISTVAGQGSGQLHLLNEAVIEGDTEVRGLVTATDGVSTGVITHFGEILVENTMGIAAGKKFETNTIDTKDQAVLNIEKDVSLQGNTLHVDAIEGDLGSEVVFNNDVKVSGTINPIVELDTPTVRVNTLTSDNPTIVVDTKLNVQDVLTVEEMQSSGAAIAVLTDLQATGDILVDTIRANAQAEVTLDTDVDVAGTLNAVKLASNKITSASTGTVLVESSDLEVDEANMLKTNTITTAGSTATAVTIATDLIVDSSNTLTVDTVDASAGAGKVTVDTSAEVTGTLKVAGVLTAEDGVSTNKLSHTGNIDVANTLDIADGQSLITDTVTSDNGKVTITAHLEVAAGSELQADTIDTSGAALEVAKAVNVAGDVSTAGVVSAGSVDTDTIDSTSSATINVVDVLNAQSGLQSDTITSSTGGDVTVSTTLVVADGEELHANTLVATAPASVITVKNDMTLDSATLTTPTLKVVTMNNDANGVTVDDNLIVNAVVKTDELESAVGSQVHVNDHLEVDSNFELRTDTIVSAKDDQQVTVSDDLTVTGVATVASLKTDTIVAATAAVEVGSDLEVGTGNELRTNSVQPTSGGTMTIGASDTTTVLDGAVQVTELDSPDGSPIVVKANFSFAGDAGIQVETVTFDRLSAPTADGTISVESDMAVAAGLSLTTDQLSATVNGGSILVGSSVTLDAAETLQTNKLRAVDSELMVGSHLIVDGANELRVDNIDSAGAATIAILKGITVSGDAEVDALTLSSMDSTTPISVKQTLSVEAGNNVQTDTITSTSGAEVEVQASLLVSGARVTTNELTTIGGANLVVDAPTVDVSGAIIADALTVDALASTAASMDVQTSLIIDAAETLQTDAIKSTTENGNVLFNSHVEIKADQELRVNTLLSKDSGSVTVTEDLVMDGTSTLRTDNIASVGGTVLFDGDLSIASGRALRGADRTDDGAGNSIVIAGGLGRGNDAGQDHAGGNVILRGGQPGSGFANGETGVVLVDSDMTVRTGFTLSAPSIQVPAIDGGVDGIVTVAGDLVIDATDMLKTNKIAPSTGSSVEVDGDATVSGTLSINAIAAVAGEVTFDDDVKIEATKSLTVDTLAASGARLVADSPLHIGGSDPTESILAAKDVLAPSTGSGPNLLVRGANGNNGDGGSLVLQGGKGSGGLSVDGTVEVESLLQVAAGAEVAGGLTIDGNFAINSGDVAVATDGTVAIESGAGKSFQLRPGDKLEIVYASDNDAVLEVTGSGKAAAAELALISTDASGSEAAQYSWISGEDGSLRLERDSADTLVEVTANKAIEMTAGVFDPGTGAPHTGGSVSLTAGSPALSGAGGDVTLAAGAGAGGSITSTAGRVVLVAGDHGAQDGGDVTLTAGTSSGVGAKGGNVLIRPGVGDVDGDVVVYPAGVGLDSALRVTGTGSVQLGNAAINTEDTLVSSRSLIVDQAATGQAAILVFDSQTEDFTFTNDLTDLSLSDGTNDYVAFRSGTGAVEIGTSLDIGPGNASIANNGDVVAADVKAELVDASSLTITPATNQDAVLTFDGDNETYTVVNDFASGDLTVKGSAGTIVAVDGAAGSVTVTTLETTGALVGDSIESKGALQVAGDVVIASTGDAAIDLKVTAAQEDFRIVNASADRQVRVLMEDTTALLTLDAAGKSAHTPTLLVGGTVAAPNAEISATGALTVTAVDAGAGDVKTGGAMTADTVEADTSVEAPLVTVTTTLNAMNADATVKSLDAQTGAISTSGTLAAGESTLDSLVVGDGTNAWIKFDTGAADVNFELRQDDVNKALLLKDLNSGAGTLLSVATGTNTTWIKSLEVGDGAPAPASIDDTGALEVTSVDVGTGTIVTSGALNAGTTNVASLVSADGVKATNTVEGHDVKVGVTGNDDAVVVFDVDNASKGRDFYVYSDTSEGRLAFSTDGTTPNDILRLNSDALSAWITEVTVDGDTTTNTLTVNTTAGVAGTLTADDGIVLRRLSATDVVLTFDALTPAKDFTITNSYSGESLVIADDNADELLVSQANDNQVAVAALQVGGTTVGSVLQAVVASIDETGAATVTSLDAGTGLITTSGNITTTASLMGGATTVDSLTIDRSGVTDATMTFDTAGLDFDLVVDATGAGTFAITDTTNSDDYFIADLSTSAAWMPAVRVGNLGGAPNGEITAAGDITGVSLDVGAGTIDGGVTTVSQLDISGAAAGFDAAGALTAVGVNAGGNVTGVADLTATGQLQGADLMLGDGTDPTASITFDLVGGTSDFSLTNESNALTVTEDGATDLLVVAGAGKDKTWVSALEVGNALDSAKATITADGDIDANSLKVATSLETSGALVGASLDLSAAGASISAGGALTVTSANLSGGAITNAANITASGVVAASSGATLGNGTAGVTLLTLDNADDDFLFGVDSQELTVSFDNGGGATTMMLFDSASNTVEVENFVVGANKVTLDGTTGDVACNNINAGNGKVETTGDLSATGAVTLGTTTVEDDLNIENAAGNTVTLDLLVGSGTDFHVINDGTTDRLRVEDESANTLLELAAGTKTVYVDNVDIGGAAAVVTSAGGATFNDVTVSDALLTLVADTVNGDDPKLFFSGNATFQDVYIAAGVSTPAGEFRNAIYFQGDLNGSDRTPLVVDFDPVFGTSDHGSVWMDHVYIGGATPDYLAAGGKFNAQITPDGDYSGNTMTLTGAGTTITATGEISSEGLNAGGGAIATTGTLDAGATTLEDTQVDSLTVTSTTSAQIDLDVDAKNTYRFASDGETLLLRDPVGNTDFIRVDNSDNYVAVNELRVPTLIGGEELVLAADGAVTATKLTVTSAGAISTSGAVTGGAASFDDVTVKTDVVVKETGNTTSLTLGADNRDFTFENLDTEILTLVGTKVAVDTTLMTVDGANNRVTVNELYVNAGVAKVTSAGAIECTGIDAGNGNIVDVTDLSAVGTVTLGSTSLDDLTIVGAAQRSKVYFEGGNDRDVYLQNDGTSQELQLVHIVDDGKVETPLMTITTAQVGGGNLEVNSLSLAGGTFDVTAGGAITGTALDAGNGKIETTGDLSAEGTVTLGDVTATTGLAISTGPAAAVASFEVSGASMSWHLDAGLQRYFLKDASTDTNMMDIDPSLSVIEMTDVTLRVSDGGVDNFEVTSAGKITATELDLGTGNLGGDLAAGAATLDSVSVSGTGTITASGLIKGEGFDANGQDIVNVNDITLSGSFTAATLRAGTGVATSAKLQFDLDSNDFELDADSTTATLTLTGDGNDVLVADASAGGAEFVWTKEVRVGNTTAAPNGKISAAGDITGDSLVVVGAISGAALTGTSLELGGGAITNAGAISGTSLVVGNTVSASGLVTGLGFDASGGDLDNVVGVNAQDGTVTGGAVVVGDGVDATSTLTFDTSNATGVDFYLQQDEAERTLNTWATQSGADERVLSVTFVPASPNYVWTEGLRVGGDYTLNDAEFTVDVDGDVTARAINVNSGAATVTQTGDITGATMVLGSTLDVTGDTTLTKATLSDEIAISSSDDAVHPTIRLEPNTGATFAMEADSDAVLTTANGGAIELSAVTSSTVWNTSLSVGDTFANVATSPFRVDNDGDVVVRNVSATTKVSAVTLEASGSVTASASVAAENYIGGTNGTEMSISSSGFVKTLGGLEVGGSDGTSTTDGVLKVTAQTNLAVLEVKAEANAATVPGAGTDEWRTVTVSNTSATPYFEAVSPVNNGGGSNETPFMRLGYIEVGGGTPVQTSADQIEQSRLTTMYRYKNLTATPAADIGAGTITAGECVAWNINAGAQVGTSLEPGMPMVIQLTDTSTPGDFETFDWPIEITYNAWVDPTGASSAAAALTRDSIIVQLCCVDGVACTIPTGAAVNIVFFDFLGGHSQQIA